MTGVVLTTTGEKNATPSQHHEAGLSKWEQCNRTQLGQIHLFQQNAPHSSGSGRIHPMVVLEGSEWLCQGGWGLEETYKDSIESIFKWEDEKKLVQDKNGAVSPIAKARHVAKKGSHLDSRSIGRNSAPRTDVARPSSIGNILRLCQDRVQSWGADTKLKEDSEDLTKQLQSTHLESPVSVTVGTWHPKRASELENALVASGRPRICKAILTDFDLSAYLQDYFAADHSDARSLSARHDTAQPALTRESKNIT
ncbi:hypothetical protein B0H14DRAFT_3154697 [Mycena olivaceomarginata]|nr:hypothetical protein B0H14DRAFT_3154697 [Mycena olivaceomarginata]